MQIVEPRSKVDHSVDHAFASNSVRPGSDAELYMR